MCPIYISLFNELTCWLSRRANTNRHTSSTAPLPSSSGLNYLAWVEMLLNLTWKNGRQSDDKSSKSGGWVDKAVRLSAMFSLARVSRTSCLLCILPRKCLTFEISPTDPPSRHRSLCWFPWQGLRFQFEACQGWSQLSTNFSQRHQRPCSKYSNSLYYL